ncbi:MAG: hypothetical protein RBS84_06770 [Kiritimatiellia bacterium]|jgi:hypothetical protein|nr:hypothetical protein [Kiritimatiellia bacterium]
MERANFATGSIEVRGSGTVHRILSFLGAFFLGIGPAAQREREDENWWDREPQLRGDDSVPVVFGRQTELFDETGRVAYEAAPSSEALPREVPVPVAAPVAVRSAPRTVVSVQSRSRRTARVVATTRARPATRVVAVSKAASTTKGDVARHLMMSQSLSSGREESRWFSVPQRALLPRYQLFEGADGVTEETGGILRVNSRSKRAQRGCVWFV